MASKQSNKQSRVKIIPLGGVDEIGKNMTVIEYEDQMVVVDCGMTFPSEDMPGIDLVIPDVSYLIKHQDKLKAILITHGHEDHIGAVPYVLKQVNAPLYGTRLSLALIENKLKEHRMTTVQLNTVTPGESVKIGCFTVDFIRVNHSIAGATALAIHTPIGTIVHTGDFKIDLTPIDHEVIDFAKLAELGRRGVLALLCDSTNVERPGFTMSERKVGEAFNHYFRDAKGRIIVAMFASNVYRIQQVVDCAVRHNRKVCLNGRSMVNVATVAMQLGELKIPEGRLVEMDDIDDFGDNELVVLTTGSQGEPMSGLTRMANNEHRKMEIKASDLVIISATPIPGNEKTVSRVINQLIYKGANVIYEALAEVHVSGHACQEELKMMHALIKPRYFVPVHGEYRHLYHHAMLAESMGLPKERIVIPQIGDVIEVNNRSIRKTGVAPVGSVLVDGLGIGDVGNIVLRDRKHLSQDGLLIVVMAIQRENGQIMSGPDIISRGFVYVRESEELMEQARTRVRNVLLQQGSIGSDWTIAKTRVRDDLREFLYQKTKRNPMILPVIVEV